MQCLLAATCLKTYTWYVIGCWSSLEFGPDNFETDHLTQIQRDKSIQYPPEQIQNSAAL